MRGSNARLRRLARRPRGAENRAISSRPARASGETGKMRDRLCLRSSCSCGIWRYSGGGTRHAFRRLPQSIHRPVKWRSSIVAERALSISRERVLPRPDRARGHPHLSVQRRPRARALHTVWTPPLRGLPEPSVHQAAAASRKSARHRSATRVARIATASREIILAGLAVKERKALKMIDFRRLAGQRGTAALSTRHLSAPGLSL